MNQAKLGGVRAWAPGVELRATVSTGGKLVEHAARQEQRAGTTWPLRVPMTALHSEIVLTK